MNRTNCTLFVVHVPKVAGSTFRWILDRQYPQERIFKIGDDIPGERQRFIELPESEKAKLLAVFGHMCYGWHGAMPSGRECAYVTILREPVARVVSLYHYTWLPGHYLENVTKKMNLEQFASSGVTCTVDNGMVRQLCGDDEFLREPYADMVIPYGDVTTEHLDKAKENLRQFAAVGTSEGFREMLRQMQTTFGWRIPDYGDWNVTRWARPDDTITERGLQAVRDVNVLDVQLYEWVRGGMQ